MVPAVFEAIPSFCISFLGCPWWLLNFAKCTWSCLRVSRAASCLEGCRHELSASSAARGGREENWGLSKPGRTWRRKMSCALSARLAFCQPPGQQILLKASSNPQVKQRDRCSGLGNQKSENVSRVGFGFIKYLSNVYFLKPLYCLKFYVNKAMALRIRNKEREKGKKLRSI